MNGYNEKGHYEDEPEPGSFVKAFDAFRKAPTAASILFLSYLPTYLPALPSGKSRAPRLKENKKLPT